MINWLNLIVASVSALSLYWMTAVLVDISDSLRAIHAEGEKRKTVSWQG